MALIDCYKCGKQISDREEPCPHCGASVLTYKKLPDGSVFGYEYDENGKLTHERDSDGEESWYDENGK